MLTKLKVNHHLGITLDPPIIFFLIQYRKEMHHIKRVRIFTFINISYLADNDWAVFVNTL